MVLCKMDRWINKVQLRQGFQGTIDQKDKISLMFKIPLKSYKKLRDSHLEKKQS